ncbi:unnamed protein product [Peronospora belbahrii]|uniref:PH domain-containing protein n=1 Tax=Peronospora belbahrii TaxID=622444 RepID=A0AAU9L4S1_9STRA|nr:unnamed protein product [Peronospora belbahrii]CAH0513286.1 unnamed protein product [Peronospora belbahrii]
MTDDNESIETDDQEDQVHNSNTRDIDDQDFHVLLNPQCPLSDWVYWQRDAITLPDCWTRVFAVFYNNMLWLYRYEDASARSLLVRIHVTALRVGQDVRQLQFRDARTTLHVQLCLPDTETFCRWHCHVTTAVAQLPIVKDDLNVAIVSTVTSVLQKKRFWKDVATRMLQRNKYHCARMQEDNRMVVYNRQQNRKRMSQLWKNVSTALKNALKLDLH